jgi:two-component system phosphate regulon response regulator PhoB
MAGSEPPLLLLVAAGPEWRDALHQALVQEGFRVVQQPLPLKPRDLLAQIQWTIPPALLVLHLPSGPWTLQASLQLLERLRRSHPQIPLLLLSEQSDDLERSQLLDAGADDVLSRPFGLREFVARCRALLRRVRRSPTSGRSPAQEQVLRIGAIQLYRQQCKVTRAGVEVSLTPREFRLLEHLMLHPGRAFSRDQLIEQVWGPDYDGDNKSVDVHVLWLRRKLSLMAPHPEAIVTLRGLGYRLDGPQE